MLAPARSLYDQVKEHLPAGAAVSRLRDTRASWHGSWEYGRSATWWECCTSGAPSVCLSVTVGDAEARGGLGGMLQNWAREVAVDDARCRPTLETLLRRLQDMDLGSGGGGARYGFTARAYRGYRCLLSPSIVVCVRSRAARNGLWW